jgi:putative DNA primase/helicase
MTIPVQPPPMDAWAHGVRASEVPIAPGGDPSPFADLSDVAPKAPTLRDVFPHLFAAEPREPHLDADHIKACLYGREQEVVAAFRGPPNRALSSKKELRWGNKGSFSLAIAGNERGFWFDHELGRGGDIFDLIKQEQGCDFVEALKFAKQFVGGYAPNPCTPRPARDDAESDSAEIRRIENAVDIWDSSTGLRGTLAETYLRSRSIEVPDEALDVLRFHPKCPWRNSTAPALVAVVRDIFTRELVSVHRTPLTPDARKMCQPMSFGPISGGAIKLSGEDLTSTELTIAEGIETALSAMMLGFPPTWSVICAGGIAKFPVLPHIERLTTIIDNDASGGGQRAAAECRARWEARGHRVRTVMPPNVGDDLNDVLRAQRDQK